MILINLFKNTNNSIQFYSIYIPKNRTHKKCYELILPIKVDGFYTDNQTTVLYKLGNSNNSSTYVRFNIYEDKGFCIDKRDEEIFLNNTTSEDQRIVKGFIRDYQNKIKRICRGNPADLITLSDFRKEASRFQVENRNKMVQQRRIDQRSIFSNVVFI